MQRHSIHATDQPLNKALGLDFKKHKDVQPLTARRMPSQQTSLRQLLWEMNIGYQIQYRGDKSNEIGFACIATSYLRKDSAMERIRAFVDSHNLPYEVIDGSGLMFYVHDCLND